MYHMLYSFIYSNIFTIPQSQMYGNTYRRRKAKKNKTLTSLNEDIIEYTY